MLGDVAADLDPVLEERVTALAGRLREGAFRIAVCGGFSNGKSTLVNALLGADLLPVGVLPVTAIATEVVHGPGVTAHVELQDGSVESPTLDDLALWVSEPDNPNNVKGVVRVVVTTPAPLLEPGVSLVDTPGLESIFEHNDTTAMATIRDAEGALVVLSADAPLTAAERRLLDVVAERSSATFFVLNRTDHLSASEISEAVAFVCEAVEAAIGERHPVFAVSARNALQAHLGDSDGDGGVVDAGIDALLAALTRFVEEDLVAVRHRAFAAAVRRLIDDVADADAVAAAAAGLAADELADRIARFEQAAAAERRKIAEDTVLLATAVNDINADLADWLAREGRAPVPGAANRFAATAARVPLRRLEEALDGEVRALVEARFDDLRPEAVARVENAWGAVASDFARRVQERADAIRAIAAETFGARLNPVPIPEVSEEPDRFWYLFFRPELPDAPLWRALRLLLPRGLVRRRLVDAARKQVAAEMDKHSGRARSELSDRLTATHRRFAREVTAHVESLIGDIGRAARRARGHAAAVGDQALLDDQRRQRRAAALAAARAATINERATR